MVMPAGNLIGGNLVTPDQPTVREIGQIGENLINAKAQRARAKDGVYFAPSKINAGATLATPPIGWSLTTTNPISSPVSWLAVQSLDSGTSSKFGLDAFSIFGAFGPTVVSNTARRAVGMTSVLTNGTPSFNTAIYSCDVTDSVVAIGLINPSGGLGATAVVNVKIDDQYAFAIPQTIPADGTPYFLYLPLTTFAKHRIDVQVGSCGFVGVYTSAIGQVTPAAQRGHTMLVLSDSTGRGQGGIGFLGAWPRVLADTLGIDNVHQSCVSGTGWLATNGASKKFRDRLAMDVYPCPDLAHVLIMGGINDYNQGFTAAQVKAEAETLIDELQKNLPGILLQIASPYYPGGASTIPAGFIAIYQGLQDACNNKGVDFIDVLNPGLANGVTALQTTGTVAASSTSITMQAQPVQRATYMWPNGERFQARAISGTSAPYTVTADGAQLTAHTNETVIQVGSPNITGNGHAATITTTTPTISNAGSGGTNGTFALSFTGSNIVRTPAGTFTVAGGVVTAVTLTDTGQFSTTVAPTPVFTASAGLTGVVITLPMGSGPVGYGSADAAVGSDALHPTPVGHQLMGISYANAILSAIGPQ